MSLIEYLSRIGIREGIQNVFPNDSFRVLSGSMISAANALDLSQESLTYEAALMAIYIKKTFKVFVFYQEQVIRTDAPNQPENYLIFLSMLPQVKEKKDWEYSNTLDRIAIEPHRYTIEYSLACENHIIPKNVDRSITWEYNRLLRKFAKNDHLHEIMPYDLKLKLSNILCVDCNLLVSFDGDFNNEVRLPIWKI